MARQPFRVLQVVGVMNRGGTESMLMNHYRALDHDRVQFDFIVHGDKIGAFEQEIESLGGRIYHAPLIRPWTYPRYFKWLNDFFKNHAHEYVAVHGHIQENSGFALHYAKKYNIKNRLMTSHIAPKSSDYKFIFRQFARLYFKSSATKYLACGVDAGKYLYQNAPFEVMHNAINAESFRYNPTIRKEIRSQLGINDQFVIGHVGRFGPQKNHKFIIAVFAELLKQIPNSRLILVGSGKLAETTKAQAEQLNISDKVIFAGSRADVYKLMQAFDVFFMPSLYEGLPVSVIEAQAAGLPCVLSDTIDPQCVITNDVDFVSLDVNKQLWVQTLAKYLNHEHKDTLEEITDAGYEVQANLLKLYKLYGLPTT